MRNFKIVIILVISVIELWPGDYFISLTSIVQNIPELLMIPRQLLKI